MCFLQMPLAATNNKLIVSTNRIEIWLCCVSLRGRLAEEILAKHIHASADTIRRMQKDSRYLQMAAPSLRSFRSLRRSRSRTTSESPIYSHSSSSYSMAHIQRIPYHKRTRGWIGRRRHDSVWHCSNVALINCTYQSIV
jgi:hypothetical protein